MKTFKILIAYNRQPDRWENQMNIQITEQGGDGRTEERVVEEICDLLNHYQVRDCTYLPEHCVQKFDGEWSDCNEPFHKIYCLKCPEYENCFTDSDADKAAAHEDQPPEA